MPPFPVARKRPFQSCGSQASKCTPDFSDVRMNAATLQMSWETNGDDPGPPQDLSLYGSFALEPADSASENSSRTLGIVGLNALHLLLTASDAVARESAGGANIPLVNSMKINMAKTIKQYHY
jgi:hypothetical protein